MMNSYINVCLSSDDNYSKYAGVVIASILANATKDDNLVFYILDGNISDENKQKILALKSIKNCSIKFIQVDEKMFELYKSVKTHKYLTVQAYYRLKMTELMPTLDKVIYLDCDTIVESSLCDLYNININNFAIGACLDARVYHSKRWRFSNYINSGMVVFNLDYIKNFGVENLFDEYTKAHFDEIKTGDQDIINFALKDKIKIIDGCWNVQVSGFASRTNYTYNPKIIHYIGQDKPWIFGSNTYFKDRFFKYLQLTPWALSDKEQEYMIKENKRVSRKLFWKKRPYAIVHPKYWYVYFRSILKI